MAAPRRIIKRVLIAGDIEELKKRHEREIEELSKVQEMNKVRQEQELHAKLKARRNYRKRVVMQQQEQAS